jgi:hypothetical protein
VGFFSAEQVVYMSGMTTQFRRPEKRSSYGGDNPYESMTGLIPADSSIHVYLLPHTSMKFSTGMRIASYYLESLTHSCCIVIYFAW